MSGSRQVVSATNVTGLPFIENFTLNASYSLVEIATKKTVLTGRATTTVSYDPSGTQRFARISGMHDAERRAAKVICRQRDIAAVVVFCQRRRLDRQRVVALIPPVT